MQLKNLRLIVLGLLLTLTAGAHFTFILPWPGGEMGEMILSETLSNSEAVNPSIASQAKLKIREAVDGSITDVEMRQDGNRFVMRLPGRGDRVLYGIANLGVAQRGNNAKPHLLLYYPKTILGAPFHANNRIGEASQVLEMVPQGEAGNVRLQLIARGKPLPNSEITVILPDGTSQKATTDSNGLTNAFTQSGRYGAWARFWEDSPGEQDGKKYDQQRHYAMLVFDAYTKVPTGVPLPEKTSSFGAAADGDWLYVYGGHIARTHSYSTESVSGKFARLRNGASTWEELPGGPGLQGMNLAALGDGRICRVGGMEPRNKPGTKSDNHSIADVACFDASKRDWGNLPSLPEGRSSHDVAVINGKLFVTGGWTMQGATKDSKWAKTTLSLDLRNPQAGWAEIPQPFQRRALIVAAHRDRMYVIGGITPTGAVSTDVDIYEPSSGKWSKGPALPGPDINGFAPAAAVHQGKLYVSIGDGSLFRLDETQNRWVDAGRSSKRLAHRMVSMGDSLWILGGADKGNNFDLTERFTFPAPAISSAAAQ